MKRGMASQISRACVCRGVAGVTTNVLNIRADTNKPIIYAQSNSLQRIMASRKEISTVALVLFVGK